ncbi:MAG: DNA repair protein RecN [Myxococcales bacterium]|nr:DNA repair protein RecN [Myxococcales bacterium]
MLEELRVRDFVLIDGLAIELGKGLSVLSGETGAGKSILVDALALVLGGRARPEVVRTGCESAEVEASFDVGALPALRRALEDAGLAEVGDEGRLLVRRVVSSAGRSKAFVNGRLVPVALLAELTRGLCDIASQHESQTLCDPASHAGLLDAYAGLDADREALGAVVEQLSALERARREEQSRLDTLRAREDFLRFQLAEIEKLAPEAGEESALEAERGRLRHGTKLAEVTSAAEARLESTEGSVLDTLGRTIAELGHAAALDERLAPLVRQVESAATELRDVAHALGRYAESVDQDPNRLSEVEERLYELSRLLRKHGPTTTELLAFRDSLAAELATLDAGDSKMAQHERERAALLGTATTLARALSKARRAAAAALGEAIAQELASLSMGKARIVVEVATVAAPDGDEGLVVDADASRARLGRTGIDRVELLIAPNPGEDPRPLRRIASGGELSRALLAVKRVLASKDAHAGLYVFDEVDAGVGGAVAEAIGRKIAEVARHHQVLCITHLPQIAAFADVHFHVEKREQKGRTVSVVRRLETEERVEELARMMGGSKLTDTTRRAAEEMLAVARAASGPAQKGEKKKAKKA